MFCNALYLCNYTFLPAILAIKELPPVFKITRKLSWTIYPQKNMVCVLFPFSGGILIAQWKSVILPRAFDCSLVLLQLIRVLRVPYICKIPCMTLWNLKIHLCLPQVLSNKPTGLCKITRCLGMSDNFILQLAKLMAFSLESHWLMACHTRQIPWFS